jgi:hypothetical protein
MVAGYEYKPLKKLAADDTLKVYEYPPNKPIMFGLAGDISLRQVAVGYDLLIKPGDSTIPYYSGHVNPHEVVALPEIDTFADINVDDSLKLAKVSSIGGSSRSSSSGSVVVKMVISLPLQ